MNPVPGYKVSTKFKATTTNKGQWSLGWHTGDDFAAPVGTPIVAATPGRVIAANAYDRVYGYKVIIRWDKYDVWYCHMPKDAATVKVGQTVKAGQRIGSVGREGNVTGAHLHMEARHAGAKFAASSFVNPSIAINYKAPSEKVKVRFGTLNIPLDAAKLPDGEARAKIAARQVHEANLDFVAMQELDRVYKDDTWHYARIMLKALREFDKSWKIIKPTTLLNENVSFYRPGNLKLKRKLDDLILRSPAGGRHASRYTFDKQGKTIAVRNTHLVEGKANGESRELQAKEIAKYIGGSTVILGDFNQGEMPKVFDRTHKSARLSAVNSGTRNSSTFERMEKTLARTDGTGILDQIVVPKAWTVNGYTVVGVSKNGAIKQPRASDHFLVIVSVTIP